MKKFLSLSLTLMMALSLAACGSGGGDTSADTSTKDPGITGEVQSYGDFASVLVPEGWTLGTYQEETYYINLQSDDDRSIELTNFYDNEGGMMSLQDYSKSVHTDGQTDISGTYNGITWTGFQYQESDELYSFQVYTTDLDLNYLEASSTGYAFDSPEAEAVLSSIVMAK